MNHDSATIFSAVREYCRHRGTDTWSPRGALIDMDGVLYDSMPGHAAAWKRMTDEEGMDCTTDEFFLYEGMTGAATINLLFRRYKGREATPAEIEELYGRKARYFRESGKRLPMPGADQVLAELIRLGIERVLVTGSAQSSLIEALMHDYPGAFPEGHRITARDVINGKPNPEPYLKGIALLNLRPEEAIVIENAPLGVEAGHAAGCFTIGVTTGPIPSSELVNAGADLVVESMSALADMIPEIVSIKI